MKKLSFFFLILFSTLCHSQVYKEIATNEGEKIILYSNHTWEYRVDPLADYNPSTSFKDLIIKKDAFTVEYCNPLKQARWVAYELTKEEATSKIAERTDYFTPDYQYSTATDKDYAKSGFDRGHLAPAADMGFSIKAMDDCFSYVNISPQIANLNRGIWKQLEDRVRSWAVQEGSLYVVTSGILQDNLKTVGKGKVAIPNYFYKVILDLTPPCKAIAFVFPNGESTGSLSNYTTTIDNVERLTNIDFFPQLPDYLEKEFESQLNPEDWGLEPAENSLTINKQPESPGNVQTRSINANPQNLSPQSSTSTGQSRCQAITQAGTQCKRNAQSGSKYCWQHQGYVGTDADTQQNVSNQTGTIKSTSTPTAKSSGTTSSGRTLITGPRGGTYYINKNGNKTYVKKK